MNRQKSRAHHRKYATPVTPRVDWFVAGYESIDRGLDFEDMARTCGLGRFAIRDPRSEVAEMDDPRSLFAAGQEARRSEIEQQRRVQSWRAAHCAA